LHSPVKNPSPLQHKRQAIATKRTPTKKPALISQVRAVKSKETLKNLKN
jgi:hypothetical protein